MRKMQMYYIIDSSEEMIGARIGTVNASLEESYPLLREIEEQLDSDILLRVMNYGTWASWHEDKPTHVNIPEEEEFITMEALVIDGGLTDRLIDEEGNNDWGW